MVSASAKSRIRRVRAPIAFSMLKEQRAAGMGAVLLTGEFIKEARFPPSMGEKEANQTGHQDLFRTTEAQIFNTISLHLSS